MRKTIYTITALMLSFIFIFTSLGGPGGADDPLVTVDYLKEIFTTPIEKYLSNADKKAITDMESHISSSLTALDGKVDSKIDSDAIVKAAVKKAVADKVKSELLSNAVSVTLQAGEKITAKTGTKIIKTSGSATLFGNAGDAVNLTRGNNANVGTKAPSNTLYFFTSNDTAGFEAAENNTSFIIYGQYKKVGLYEPKNTKYAQALYDLGLFRGTNDGFDLHKKGDRLQGLIMLIRLMGKENAALAHSGKTPFVDLTGWLEGHKYIGYGYDNGITNGTNAGNTTFSPSVELDARMYYTFVLRALGYDDKKGDFNWETTSVQKAIELGLITEKEQTEIAANGLYRDYIVKISYNALKAKLKGTSQTLGQKLIADGVFTQEAYNKVAQSVLSD